MPDGDDPRMPGKIGLHAIGGVLEHLRALTCITSPTVNSYRRFWDAGFWAPIFADWGFQNRTTALRISRAGALRVPVGGLRGEPVPVVRGAADGDEGRPRAQPRPRAPRGAEHLRGDRRGQGRQADPETLGEALEALEADDVVKAALPGDMYRVFMHYKTRRVEAVHRDGQRLGHPGVPGHVARRKGAIRLTCAASQASSIETARPTSGPR